MNNRELIEQVVTAFDANDVNAVLDHLSDDIAWEMLGDKTIHGKEAIREVFGAGVKTINSSVRHMLLDGDHAAVTGEVKCQAPDGTVFEMYYCDVYEISDGKVSRMITYPIVKK